MNGCTDGDARTLETKGQGEVPRIERVAVPLDVPAVRLGALGPRDLLVLGELPGGALAAWPESITTTVVLTGERRAQDLERHPEVAAYESALLDRLADPVEVHRWERHPYVANVYRRIDDMHYGMAGLAIAVEAPFLNLVLSFRRARRREVERGRRRGLFAWKR